MINERDCGGIGSRLLWVVQGTEIQGQIMAEN